MPVARCLFMHVFVAEAVRRPDSMFVTSITKLRCKAGAVEMHVCSCALCLVPECHVLRVWANTDGPNGTALSASFCLPASESRAACHAKNLGRCVLQDCQRKVVVKWSVPGEMLTKWNVTGCV